MEIIYLNQDCITWIILHLDSEFEANLLHTCRTLETVITEIKNKPSYWKRKYQLTFEMKRFGEIAKRYRVTVSRRSPEESLKFWKQLYLSHRYEKDNTKYNPNYKEYDPLCTVINVDNWINENINKSKMSSNKSVNTIPVNPMNNKLFEAMVHTLSSRSIDVIFISVKNNNLNFDDWMTHIELKNWISYFEIITRRDDFRVFQLLLTFFITHYVEQIREKDIKRRDDLVEKMQGLLYYITNKNKSNSLHLSRLIISHLDPKIVNNHLMKWYVQKGNICFLKFLLKNKLFNDYHKHCRMEDINDVKTIDFLIDNEIIDSSILEDLYLFTHHEDLEFIKSVIKLARKYNRNKFTLDAALGKARSIDVYNYLVELGSETTSNNFLECFKSAIVSSTSEYFKFLFGKQNRHEKRDRLSKLSCSLEQYELIELLARTLDNDKYEIAKFLLLPESGILIINVVLLFTLYQKKYMNLNGQMCLNKDWLMIPEVSEILILNDNRTERNVEKNVIDCSYLEKLVVETGRYTKSSTGNYVVKSCEEVNLVKEVSSWDNLCDSVSKTMEECSSEYDQEKVKNHIVFNAPEMVMYRRRRRTMFDLLYGSSDKLE
jgi:hypothetical protein